MTTTAALTPAACRRLVTDDDRIDRIFVVTLTDRRYPDDQPLISPGAYWAAPARWFQGFLDYYAGGPRKSHIVPGVWRPDGKTLAPYSPDDPETLKLATKMITDVWDPAIYTRQLTPVTVAGQQAYVRPAFAKVRHFAAVFTDPAGREIGVRADWLQMLTGDGAPQDLPSPYGYKWDVPQPGQPLDLRQREGGPRKPIGIFLPRINKHDGHYEGDPGTPERRYVPASEDPPAPALAAVISPYLLAAKDVDC